MKRTFSSKVIIITLVLLGITLISCQGNTTTLITGSTTNGNITTISSGEDITTSYTGVYVPVSIVAIKGTGISGGLLSIYETGSVQLEALIAPSNATNKSVVWTSSDDAVATVSVDGELLGVSPGEAIITVTAETKSATITVTVMPIVEVTGMSFAKSNYDIFAQKFQAVTLTLADQVQFTPTESTYKDIIWTVEPIETADPTHVSISATGDVSVIKEDAVMNSQYLVTATSNSNPDVSTTTIVTVKHLHAESVNVRWSHEPAPNPSNTYDFPLSYSNYIGLNLSVETTPSGAMDNFVFTSNNPDVVSIVTDEKFTYGSFQIHDLGTAIISVVSESNPAVSRDVTLNIVATPVGESFVIVDPLNPEFNLSLTASDISVIPLDTRSYWNFDPEGATYVSDRLASISSWSNIEGFSEDLIEMNNSGNGQSIFDGGYGIMFDSWDWPEDNDQSNLFVYNKITVPELDILKIRVRSQSVGGTTGKAKFRIRLVDPVTYESTFLMKDALVLQSDIFNFPPDRPKTDMGTQDTESYWITLDRVPDFTIGEDWFHFTIPAEIQNEEMLIVFEVDDIHTPDVGTDGCDRVQLICIYFIDETNPDPNDLRTPE